MKKSMLISALAISIVATMAFTPKEKKEMQNQSIVKWIGTKVVGDDHNGTLNISEKNIKFDQGKLISGTVVVDMKTLDVLGMEGDSKNKLIGHLSSDDFFGIKTFPKATIKTKMVTPQKKSNTYDITADLTIKGITKPQKFVATVSEDMHHYIVHAKLDVDRTAYNIKYGSGSFYDDLGDKAIGDVFHLNVTLYVKK